MSSTTLNKRLSYYGKNNNERIIEGKKWSLKGAINNSYQSSTIELEDGRRFRCLINPNKETVDYDNKILSILYEDTCLNNHCVCFKQKTVGGIESTGISMGDTILWEETNTRWLVYLRYLEELAYFKAQIRKCNNYIEIDGKRYWIVLQGPETISYSWAKGGGIYTGDTKKRLTMMIKKDNRTATYFKRYQKIKLPDPMTGEKKTWEVRGTNLYYGDGVMQVAVQEDFENTIKEQAEEEAKQMHYEDEDSDYGITIVGPAEVEAYSSVEYFIENNYDIGEWILVENDNEINLGSLDSITLDVNKKKGDFQLIYRINGEDAAYLNGTVKPF